MSLDDFRRLPLEVFFDTNVVQNLLKFGEYIFEHVDSVETQAILARKGNMFREDIESLAEFLFPVHRTPVKPVISELTLYELSKTPIDEKRKRLTRWGVRLLGYSQEVRQHTGLPKLSIRDGSLGDFLPDRMDRMLLYESKRAGCNAFITMDHSTVLRYKDQLRHEGLLVLSPKEYWEKLRPWYPLWV